MSKHVPEFTPLDIAKKRLKRFMKTYKATLAECAKIMGHVDDKELTLLLEADKDHLDDKNVMETFGPAQHFAYEKLCEMRGISKAETKAQASDDGDQAESLPELARRMHKAFRDSKTGKVTHGAAAAAMNLNAPSSVKRVFGGNRLSVAMSPSMLPKMSEALAVDILKTLAACPWGSPQPKELNAYRSAKKAVPEVPYLDNIIDDVTATDNKKTPEPEEQQVSETTEPIVEDKLKVCLDRFLRVPQFKAYFDQQVEAATAVKLAEAFGTSVANMKELAPIIEVLLSAPTSDTE